jgi:RNA polymerase sigma-70 factor (ECF subfamily)
MSAPFVPEPGPPAAASDESLLERLRQGEGPAGDELVRRHCQVLLRYLQRLTGRDYLAEELHQQTWLSVLDHADRFNPASSSGGFKAWLFRIATNKANDYWRAHGREAAVRQGLRLMGEASAPASEARLEEQEQAAKLKRAIERLPESQRQVVMMRYYGNMKFVDIAQALGCPLNTALGRMHKAMLKLKEMMEVEQVAQ